MRWSVWRQVKRRGRRLTWPRREWRWWDQIINRFQTQKKLFWTLENQYVTNLRSKKHKNNLLWLINTQGTDAAKFVKSAAQLKAKEAKVGWWFIYNRSCVYVCQQKSLFVYSKNFCFSNFFQFFFFKFFFSKFLFSIFFQKFFSIFF